MNLEVKIVFKILEYELTCLSNKIAGTKKNPAN